MDPNATRKIREMLNMMNSINYVIYRTSGKEFNISMFDRNQQLDFIDIAVEWVVELKYLKIFCLLKSCNILNREADFSKIGELWPKLKKAELELNYYYKKLSIKEILSYLFHNNINKYIYYPPIAIISNSYYLNFE